MRKIETKLRDNPLKVNTSFVKAGIVFVRHSPAMPSPKNTTLPLDTLIVINTASDTQYWCRRLSVSPFTLFHLLKTVGNSVTEIGEFLHKPDVANLRPFRKPMKELTIL